MSGALKLACRRHGRPGPVPGREASGYLVTVMLVDERGIYLGGPTPTVGYAVKAHRGRVPTCQGGWIVVDTAGEVLLGLGQSTKIGEGLGDCLYMLARHLEEHPDQLPKQLDTAALARYLARKAGA